MFLKKNKLLEAQSVNALISAGSQFDGEIVFEGILHINGIVTGRIVCLDSAPGTVVISKGAIVDADVIADNIVVSGKLIGNIQSLERIEVRNPGRLEGLIYTGDLIVEAGALFEGECVSLRALTAEQKKLLKYNAVHQIEDASSLPPRKALVYDLEVEATMNRSS